MADAKTLKQLIKQLKIPAGGTVELGQYTWSKRGGYAGEKALKRSFAAAEDLGWKRAGQGSASPSGYTAGHATTYLSPEGHMLLGSMHFGAEKSENRFRLTLAPTDTIVREEATMKTSVKQLKRKVNESHREFEPLDKRERHESELEERMNELDDELFELEQDAIEADEFGDKELAQELWTQVEELQDEMDDIQRRLDVIQRRMIESYDEDEDWRSRRMREVGYEIDALEQDAIEADASNDDVLSQELRAQAEELRDELYGLQHGDYVGYVGEAHKPRGRRTGLADGSTMERIKAALVKGDGEATFIQDTIDWDYLDALVRQGLVHDDYTFNGKEVRAWLTSQGHDEFGTETSSWAKKGGVASKWTAEPRRPWDRGRNESVESSCDIVDEGYACEVCGEEHQPHWSDDDDAELEPQGNCYVKPMPLGWVYKGFKDVV